MRNGIRDSGCRFQLAYFRPASGLNEETQRRYAANLFALVRQLRYSVKNENSLDLVLFLNGIPIFTAELKNPLSAQNVEDAITQYKRDRDPREKLFAYGRCLAHFAVDPELVYVTTQLAGAKTSFLPFNQGRFGGAGNPPVPPTRDGYSARPGRLLSNAISIMWMCSSRSSTAIPKSASYSVQPGTRGARRIS